MCVAYFIFYLIGFGISTKADGGIVGNGKASSHDFQSSDYTRWIISFGLCLISVQVQNSSMAERTQLGTHIMYSFYIAAIVYPVSASWVWGRGWLQRIGFVDFVGGGVVHMVSGFGGLVATINLEPRLEVISNLNRLQLRKLKNKVKLQVTEKKKMMHNILKNKVKTLKDKQQNNEGKARNANSKQPKQQQNEQTPPQQMHQLNKDTKSVMTFESKSANTFEDSHINIDQILQQQNTQRVGGNEKYPFNVKDRTNIENILMY